MRSICDHEPVRTSVGSKSPSEVHAVQKPRDNSKRMSGELAELIAISTTEIRVLRVIGVRCSQEGTASAIIPALIIAGEGKLIHATLFYQVSLIYLGAQGGACSRLGDLGSFTNFEPKTVRATYVLT